MRFPEILDRPEFAKRVDELITNFDILPIEAVKIVREFELSGFVYTKDARKHFRDLIEEAQQTTRKRRARELH